MPALLAPEEVARQLGLRVTTLGKWRTRGRGPEFVKIGGRVRYPADKLAQWVQAQPLRTETIGHRRRVPIDRRAVS